MKPVVYFVVGIDADPRRTPIGANEGDLRKKYAIALDLVKRCVGGKCIVCVHTSPRYRDRFFKPPYIDFWKTLVHEGGELMLHPEEDLFSAPQGPAREGLCYADVHYMKSVIVQKVNFMETVGLPFTAFRGAFFGLTDDIVAVLKEVGMRIDLSCAPGVVRPEKLADWTGAPASAYYMSRQSYCKAADQPDTDSIFEIPLGWDGKGTDVHQNYLFHERSTYTKMCKVWDAIVQRCESEGRPQFVNLLCHTYSMRNTRLRNQCEKILTYMQDHHGIPVTASEAKLLYDKLYNR